jgi:glycosyltransferase involved in cell wall biosynthesis
MRTAARRYEDKRRRAFPVPEEDLKVVIVNEGLAYPPKGGNWLRTLNLMLPLARRHDITYVCRAVKDTTAAELARAFYAERGIRVRISGNPPSGNRGPSFYGRVAANLLSPLPYSIAGHRSRGVRAEIQRIHHSGTVDVWQFEALGYADALLGTEARTIVMAHNVESLIWQRLYETEPHPLKRWFIGHQVRKYERYEGRALRGASRVVAVSPEDAALLEARFGVDRPAVVDNGVDVAFFAEGANGRGRDSRRILFLGSLDWRPNLDSIDLLLNRVMPQVLAEEPDARLSIVGRNPPPALVRRIRAEPSAELHADVADVRPYLARSGVMAVPLRIGGGSRLKILEAIAAGLPVVSTRIGCEGLIFRANRDLVVVESEDQMAAALVESIRNPERAATMAANGRRVIDAYYDWSRLSDRLEQVWSELAARNTRS